MKYNILKAKDTFNSQGLPLEWPVQVNEVDDKAELPKSPWIEMTKEQLVELKDSLRGAMATWESTQKAAVQTVKDTAISDLTTAFNTMKNAETNWGTMTQAQQIGVLRIHNQVLIKLMPILKDLYNATL